MPREPGDVLFVGGTGRSGSTLLERTLARHPDVFGAGELIHLWGKAFRTDQLCACGERFSDCPVWTRIREQFFDVARPEPVEEIESRLWKVENRWFPVFGSRTTGGEKAKHLDVLARLFRTIKKVTGTRLIVDSSKLPQRGYVLAELDSVNLKVLHLVRDPRGVAYSWTKEKLRPEVDWKQEYMPRKSVARSALGWDYKNYFMERLREAVGQFRRLRYEDFVSQPDETLAGLREWLELSGGEAGGETTHHSISGNPMRFEQEEVEFELDEAWRTELSGFQKATVIGLTWPLMRKYDYQATE